MQRQESLQNRRGRLASFLPKHLILKDIIFWHDICVNLTSPTKKRQLLGYPMEISFMRRALAVAAVAAFATWQSPRAFEVDGIISASDSYTDTFSIDYVLEGGSASVGTGELRIGRDPGADGDVFLFFKAPIAVVDNVYGVAANTAGSGWSSGHKFDELKGSDKFEFQLLVNSTNKKVSVDYIELDKGNNPIVKVNGSDNGGGTLEAQATSLQRNLLNSFGTTNDSPGSPDPILDDPTTLVGWEQAF